MKDQELRDSFIKLIEKNQGIIFKVSKMYCDNETDQEDLFQDILIQLWNAFPSFKGKSKFMCFTHQEWVGWVREYRVNTKWDKWLEYVQDRYNY